MNDMKDDMIDNTNDNEMNDIHDNMKMISSVVPL